MTNIVFNAPPTVGRFMCSTAFFRLVAGPVGSGKTTGCLFEMLRRSIQQKPGPDGVRRTRWAILRTTLSQLKMTILQDILHWFRDIVTYRVSDSLVIIQFNDVYSEWYLIPLEDPEDQKRLLSMQLTGAFISECIETDPNLIAPIAGRCGRFPSGIVSPTWHGIIADTNFPVEGSPWHQLMEDGRPADWAVFKQPGGLERNAENLAYLPQTPATLQLPPNDPIRQAQGRKYYERLAANPNEAWVKRYVHAQYGDDPSGTAVYRGSWKYSFHTIEGDIDPVPGMVMLIGQDFARNPCSLICQPDHMGRLLVIEEIIAEDIGLEPHVLMKLKPALFKDKYVGKTFACVGDPSGTARSGMREENSFDVMVRMGLPAFPAPTNAIDPRIRSIEQLLMGQRGGGGPAILISRNGCPTLVRALGGMYRYSKTKLGQSKPLPDKTHPWSDIVDCLQYVCLVYNAGLTQFITRKIQPRIMAPQRPRVSAAAWT